MKKRGKTENGRKQHKTTENYYCSIENNRKLQKATANYRKQEKTTQDNK